MLVFVVVKSLGGTRTRGREGGTGGGKTIAKFDKRGRRDNVERETRETWASHVAFYSHVSIHIIKHYTEGFYTAR